MTTVLKKDLDVQIRCTQNLTEYLARGARPSEAWGIGAEMEKLVVDAETGEAAQMCRVESLLCNLEAEGGWRGIRENDRLIALVGGASSITLEPGGQLELSGELCPDLHCCEGDLARHINEVVRAAEGLGLVFLGLGVQPFTPVDRIDWLPKERYRIMGPYMGRAGDMGQRMMKQTAGLQVNCDYSDEADCVAKLRIALAISSLQYALFANSPVMEDRLTGFLSTRGEIWSRTDPDRTGLIHALFEPGAGFGTYVDYALDVPMYFISRAGRFIDLTRERYPFRRYLAEGFQGHRATLSDWDLHLSTLFPEVRLRPQIETRSADSLPPDLAVSVAALIKGLLYDEAAREEIWSLFQGQDAEERETLYRRSWRLGLRTPMGGRTLREVALDALDIARRSLQRQQKRDQRGLDESVFLEGIQEVAESGVTLAERLIERWVGSRSQKVKVLVDHCGFRR
jgi:glutamate--cysteine ligase